jgi:hypothetical protein
MIHKALSRFSNSASMSLASSRCSWSAISRSSLSIRRRCRLYSLNSSVSFDQLGGTDLIKSAIYKSISSVFSKLLLNDRKGFAENFNIRGALPSNVQPCGPAFGDRPGSLVRKSHTRDIFALVPRSLPIEAKPFRFFRVRRGFGGMFWESGY